MEQKTLRAVVAGTGFGCRIQVPALRGAGFDVAALIGTNAARTAERASANGVKESFTDLDTAISQTGADLVVISSPPFTHAPLVHRAIARGCHVLCEKPFTKDQAEAQSLLDAANAAGVVHVLGNEFRFMPERPAVARAIADGLIGEPRFATFVQINGFLKSFAEEFPDWWFDPAQGGGWLGTSASHAVDQIRNFLGEFESISGSLKNVSTTRGPVEDSFSTHFCLRNGVEGVLQQCSGAPGPPVDVTQIVGTRGRLWIDGNAVWLADAQGARELPVPQDLQLPPAPPLTDDPRQQRMDWRIMAAIEIGPYTQLCRTLRAAITGSAPPGPVKLANFVDGVANMAVLDAIRRSAGAGGSFENIVLSRAA